MLGKQFSNLICLFYEIPAKYEVCCFSLAIMECNYIIAFTVNWHGQTVEATITVVINKEFKPVSLKLVTRYFIKQTTEDIY